MPAKPITPPRKLPRTMATPSFSDFQFFDQSRIEQLFAKRRDWWHRHERMRLELEEKRRAEIEVPETLNPQPYSLLQESGVQRLSCV